MRGGERRTAAVGHAAARLQVEFTNCLSGLPWLAGLLPRRRGLGAALARCFPGRCRRGWHPATGATRVDGAWERGVVGGLVRTDFAAVRTDMPEMPDKSDLLTIVENGAAHR
ncbi:hypothetical protein GCM10010399_83120 [Dactylosporangium fulvum]